MKKKNVNLSFEENKFNIKTFRIKKTYLKEK